jgi:hypothetical protein
MAIGFLFGPLSNQNLTGSVLGEHFVDLSDGHLFRNITSIAGDGFHIDGAKNQTQIWQPDWIGSKRGDRGHPIRTGCQTWAFVL